MKRTFVVLSVGVTAALLCISGFTYFKSDRKPPEILYSGDIYYEEGMEDSDLLEGVAAHDNKDGDVTASLVVESVTVSEDGKSATVVYAARDRRNNIAKEIRLIQVKQTRQGQ